jgi:predicted SAM-dependent methyltransferase
LIYFLQKCLKGKRGRILKPTFLFAKKPTSLIAKIPPLLFAKKPTLLFTIYIRKDLNGNNNISIIFAISIWTLERMIIKQLLKKLYFNPIIQDIILFMNGYKIRPINIFNNNITLFQDKCAIELGGPTKLFEDGGKVFPIYSKLRSLDNCNFSEKNFWGESNEGDEILFNNKVGFGKQIISDASNLARIEDESYDILMSSHVIEHIANPIKALFDWNRVIKKNGLLIMVVPHKDFTYDIKRPVTKFRHIVDDYENNIGEEDETHFQEIIELHDLKKDTTVLNYSEHIRRTKDNFNTRIVHHHVFDTELVVRIVDFVGFRILGLKQIRPYHIIIIGKKLDGLTKVDNSTYLDKTSKIYKRSPFPSDKISH